MIFPAWFEIINDDAIMCHPSAFRVYGRLLRDPLTFLRPQEVKTWLWADEMHTNKRIVRSAINRLIQHGYVLELERGEKNVRRLMLRIERDKLSAGAQTDPHR